MREDNNTAANRDPCAKVHFVIAILAGGVGAARFASGMSALVEPEEIAIISNVGDDEVLHGLHISPDIDTVIYTLGGAINPDTGWGLEGETWRVMDALSDYGGLTWFRLGDRDLATHLFRTQLLREGQSLTTITEKIRKRWNVRSKILPVTDGRLRTILYSADGKDEQRLSFQEYFVRHAHRPEITRIAYEQSSDAHATDEVLETLSSASAIIIAPSNPLLSIGPILSVPGIVDLLTQRREKVVAVSPIIAGEAVKGPAAKIMAELGLGPTALGVAEYYCEIASAIVIDSADASLTDAINLLDLKVKDTNTIMNSVEASRALAKVTLDLIAEGLY
jgi:LPPG:FO 2-phospho-L-lactate transferase